MLDGIYGSPKEETMRWNDVAGPWNVGSYRDRRDIEFSSRELKPSLNARIRRKPLSQQG